MTDWVTPIVLASLVACFVVAPQFKTIGTERAIVYSTSIVGVIALVWLLLAVSGCRRRAEAREPEPITQPLWCVAAEGHWLNLPVVGLGCFSLREPCEETRRLALRYGRIRGVGNVGECRYVEVVQ